MLKHVGEDAKPESSCGICVGSTVVPTHKDVLHHNSRTLCRLSRISVASLEMSAGLDAWLGPKAILLLGQDTHTESRGYKNATTKNRLPD